MAVSFLMTALLLIAGLLLLARAIVHAIRRSRRFARRVLILGSGLLARELVKEIKDRPRLGYTLIGVVGDEGPLEHLGGIIEEVHPDRIIVAMTERQRLPLRQLLEFRLRGILVEDGVKVYERLAGKLAIESLTPVSFIFPKDFRKSRVQMTLRRALSLALTSVGLVLAAPLMAIIAVAIKLDSKGPVLFVQERVGLKGRPFRLLKFRTMHPVIEKTSEWAGDNGHRITRVGRWFRKFRLDELPQFINVLRGEMDLVGPRPHPVSNYELLVMVLRNTPECGEAIPYYAFRATIRPGITGWAQVRYGYADSLEEEIEKARYDLYYIKHMSVWLDLRILLETIKIASLGRGSEATPIMDRARAGSEQETVLVGENRLGRSNITG